MESEIHTRIRRAVSAGEFSQASTLWDSYTAQVAAEIRGRTFSAARLAQMSQLIEWTRGVVTCARAQAQRRMNSRRMELYAAAVYRRQLH